MLEVKILIPLTANDGTRFPRASHRRFEQVLKRHFPSFTRAGVVSGVYQETDMDRDERSRVYSIGLRSITEAGALREVVAFALVFYEQRSIALAFAGMYEFLSAADCVNLTAAPTPWLGATATGSDRQPHAPP